VIAALRAAELGAHTELIARAEFGGMAANDGPVPVRTLAHASRLMRDARQLGQYGVSVSEPVLDLRQVDCPRARGGRGRALAFVSAPADRRVGRNCA